jgi:acyl-CoA thioester hydrolase
MGRVTIPLERRFSDLDVLGHVNNVTYLDYLQEARVRMLINVGHMSVPDYSQVLARQEINFRKSLLLGLEPISVEMWVTKIGNTSYTLEYRILDHDGSLSADALSVMVCLDRVKQVPIPIPQSLREALEEVSE